MKLYRLRPSRNADEIGETFPQAGIPMRFSRQPGQNIRKMVSLEAPQFAPNFDGFEFLPLAKPTDLLSTSSMRYGMMVNSNLLKVLEDYCIQDHLLFNVSIKKDPGTSLPYNWIHFLKVDILSHVDFPRSAFATFQGGKLAAEIALDSVESFWRKNKEISPTGYVKSTGVKFRTMPEYDLFVIPFIDGAIYVKETLYEDIVSRGLSGLTFEEFESNFNV